MAWRRLLILIRPRFLLISCPLWVNYQRSLLIEAQGMATDGYLFRPTDRQGHILNKPLTSSFAEARLKYHLKEAN